MKQKTIANLQFLLELCDAEDRSTEYTLSFLEDVGKVPFDTVMKFMEHYAYAK